MQALTAATAVPRSGTNDTAAETEPNASSPARTANIPARDSSQFNPNHVPQIIAASSMKMFAASPSCGFFSGDDKPATITAPTKASNAARVTATRNTLSQINDRNEAEVMEGS